MSTTALVPYEPVLRGSLFQRRGLLMDLEETLGRLEREYARDAERIRHFERRYRPAVAERYDELERLRDGIQRGWEALATARQGQLPGGRSSGSPGGRSATSAPTPSDDNRRLFLSLARRIHPDRASDDTDRHRRHEMMAEATLAYRDNDGRKLQWLLEHWLAESEAIQGFGTGASWLRTNRRIAWLRYRIREMRHSMGQLHASPVARIMEEHERGRATGRNLLLEMRREITAQLARAYQEAERLRGEIEELDPALRAAVLRASGL